MIEKGQLRRWHAAGTPVFMVMNPADGRRRKPITWWILQEGEVYHRDTRFIESFSAPVQA